MIEYQGEQLYDVKEVAETLHMHPEAVRRVLRKGKIASRKIGQKIYISAEDFSEYIKGEPRQKRTAAHEG